MIKQKILVVTPRFPFEGKGACEQDRAWGIKRLVELGFEVTVITKSLRNDIALKNEAEKFSGATIIPVLYTSEREQSAKDKTKKFIKRFLNPIFIDGAAFEYTDALLKKVFKEELDSFKPDFVWFDYTYLWPLYREVRKRKIPIITRSINFEPLHFLEEDGYSLKNKLKFIPKMVSEYLSVKMSDIVFSITPSEEIVYKRWHRNVFNLPLRGLPRVVKNFHEARNRKPLHVFFMGSTYNVFHNKEALLFIIKELAPYVEEEAPGEFIFHILGSKVPEEAMGYFNKRVIYDGPKYKEELEHFLASMDIALIPSLMGAGMQQKIFEPLSRGIPTITSSRGLAGYPFNDGESVLCAESVGGFFDQLMLVRDKKFRESLSKNSLAKAKKIFSQSEIDKIVLDAFSFVKLI